MVFECNLTGELEDLTVTLAVMLAYAAKHRIIALSQRIYHARMHERYSLGGA
jgi:hypothetical protein